MEHYNWIKATFYVLACDDASQSVLFDACGERCCEINGEPFSCETVEGFHELVEFFRGETFEE